MRRKGGSQVSGLPAPTPFLTIAGHPRRTLGAYLNGPWADSKRTSAPGSSPAWRIAPVGVKHTTDAHR